MNASLLVFYLFSDFLNSFFFLLQLTFTTAVPSSGRYDGHGREFDIFLLNSWQTRKNLRNAGLFLSVPTAVFKDAMRIHCEISPRLCVFLWFHFWLDAVFNRCFSSFLCVLGARKARRRLSELAQLSSFVSLRPSVFVFLQDCSLLLEELLPDVFYGVSEKPPQQWFLSDSSWTSPPRAPWPRQLLQLYQIRIQRFWHILLQ